METDKSLLWLLTIACIGISLVSKAMTYVTYSIFPNLRLIPGSNYMCLVACLFMAQLLITVRPVFNSTMLQIVSALSGLQLFSGFKYVPFTFTAYSVLNPDRHITGIKVKKNNDTICSVYIWWGSIDCWN